MNTTNGASDRARWEVIISGKARTVRKKFGADLPSAIDTYGKAVAKFGTKRCTLRCTNIAFPPPEKLQPHDKPIGKRKGQVVTKRVTPMRVLNLRGIWWCSYCMKLRKFLPVSRSGETVQACPTCGASHKLGGIGKWNPIVWEKFEGRR